MKLSRIVNESVPDHYCLLILASVERNWNSRGQLHTLIFQLFGTETYTT